jgi:hypothetical protein
LFAQRAKNIVNKPRINEDPKTALIKELKQEIYKLKELLQKTASSLNLSLYQSNTVSVASFIFKYLIIRIYDISNLPSIFIKNNLNKQKKIDLFI